MPKINIVVHPPRPIQDENWRTLTIDWPVVPGKGQTIYLGPKGCDGVCVRVTDVMHWRGVDDIDVHCVVTTHQSKEEAFRSLTEENGWKE